MLLYELAAPLIDGIDTLQETFGSRRGLMERGSLDIAAGESTILNILPDYIRAFTEAHPQIDIRLHNVTGKEGLSLIRANAVDFAVGPMMDVPEDILFLPEIRIQDGSDRPHKHPLAARKRVTLRDISQYQLIMPPRGLTTWSLVEEAFRRRGLSFRVRLEAGGWEVVKRYVGLGMGISIVTSLCLTGSEDFARVPLDAYFGPRILRHCREAGKVPVTTG